jgi:hypothetical protein
MTFGPRWSVRRAPGKSVVEVRPFRARLLGGVEKLWGLAASGVGVEQGLPIDVLRKEGTNPMIVVPARCTDEVEAPRHSAQR